MMRFWTSILLIFPFFAFGQIHLDFVMDKDTVYVGDQMEWKYVITDTEGHKVEALDFDGINNIDNALNQAGKEYSETVEVNILKSNKNISQGKTIVQNPKVGDTISMKVAVYDFAMFSPPIPSVLPDSLEVFVDMPVIFVTPPMKMLEQDSLKINDIKGIIREESSIWDKVKPRWFLLLLLPLIGWLLYKYLPEGKEEKVEEVIEEKPIIPAHIKALESLDEIKKDELLLGENKPYHTALTRTIRQYIEDRFGINALEMTSDDIVSSLGPKLSKSQTESIRKVLNIADLVKFAKGETGTEMNKEFLGTAYRFVNETKEV